MTPETVYHRTPTVRILDHRGLIVRNIEYYRHPDTPEVTDERITHHQYDTRGFLIQSADPRLYEVGRENVSYQNDLTGRVLCTRSVDDGVSVTMNDVAGRPFFSVTRIFVTQSGEMNRHQAVTHRWYYEDCTLPGRPLSTIVQTADGKVRISDRFIWGSNSPEEQSLNLAGQCVSHYNAAGVQHTDSVALTGVPLSVSLQLLKEAENVDTVVDWQSEDVSAWNDMLETEVLTTLTTVDTTGAILITKDAAGNQRSVSYDVAGQLNGTWFSVNGGEVQVIIRSLTYSATGQKFFEEHGNGVVTTYEYECETQRLARVKTERPNSHAAGSKVLQDLHYKYDPVGNVIKITNDAESIFYWKNQKVAPENIYAYDSLYQLVSASGREMAGIMPQSNTLPVLKISLSGDDSVYTNYTRYFLYDTGGNLTQIRHSAPASGNNYTTNITVSDSSNRALLSSITENKMDVDSEFTPDGLQKCLLPGQQLIWNTSGYLDQVILVKRQNGDDDTEFYRYDSDGQRVMKTSRQFFSSINQTQKVVYLPGLEIRTILAGSFEKERFHVVTIGDAGRAQVRFLHWDNGLPSGLSNNQFRYSYDNLLGSSCLEVDAEGNLISQEEYYPYGGTAVWMARSQQEANYKTIRYSGKERDSTGLYYYGYRYYQPWVGRWLSADPSGVSAGLNVFCFVNNNPASFTDDVGLQPWPISAGLRAQITKKRNQPYELRSANDPVYQTELRKRHFWSNDQNSLSNRILNDKRINPFAESVTTQAQPEHDQLYSISTENGAVGKLTTAERNIINLYSQESLPFHTITLGFRELNDQEKAQGYHMGQGIELINALEQLPPYRGKTYRGAFIEKGFTYATSGVPVTRSMTTATAGSGERRAWQVGDYVTTKTFFSTSAAKGVAAEFIMRQRFGSDFYSDTAILNIEGSGGRNITELTHIKQAEVLYPAYTVFQVKDVQKGEFGLEIGLQEVGEDIWSNPQAIIRDYRYGSIVKQRPSHMIPHRAA